MNGIEKRMKIKELTTHKNKRIFILLIGKGGGSGGGITIESVE
jgi:hypothetical protein